MKVSTSFLLGNPTAASCQPTTINNKSAQQNKKPALFMRWMLMLLMMCTTGAYAQFAVTTNGGSGLAGTYPSLAAAVTALNGATITAPVVITCPTGTETSPAGGYNITATGTVTNTITIQGNGAANSIITAPNPAGTSGALNDAIFKITGGDFITITGFQMLENALNTTTTAGSNNMVEFGVALFYATSTNGAQNNTISNNTIDLNRTYQNTFGIYSNSTHTATAVTTSATATTTAGGNSGLKLYGNTITDVNMGILVVGPTAAADANTGIDIGGAGGAQSNIITNFGTTGTFSGYANVSGTVNGILIRNSNGFNVSFNTITSSVGGTTAGTLNGIQQPAASNAPVGTFTNTINNNSISLQSGSAAGAINGINIPSGSANGTSTLNVVANNFHTTGHTVSGTGAIIYIINASTHNATNISSNTFTNMTVNTTGSVTFISNSITPTGGITSTKTVNGNSIVTGFSKTGAGGTLAIYTDGGSSLSTTPHQNNNNNFSNITVTGATIITGWFNNDGTGSTPQKTITGNTFSNWTGGTSAINVLQNNFGGGTIDISNNTVSNITGQAAITGIFEGASNSATSTVTLASNSVTGLSSTGAGGTVIGIQNSSAGTTNTTNNNTVSGLSSSLNVTGMLHAASLTSNIFKNKICDIAGSGGTSFVLGLSVTVGATVNIINNRIGDLRAPASSIISGNNLNGINIVTTTASSTVTVHYNTIHLAATSSGTHFGSHALNVSLVASATLNTRNNIFSNQSSANGNGFTIAYHPVGTFTKNTNYNDYFAPYIYSDNTNFFTTLATYQAFAAPNDANSISANPPFLSTTCGSADFLKINTGIGTQIESGGTPVATTDDFEGDARNGSTPDIGADEFAGTPAAVCTGTPAPTVINGANSVCTGAGTTLSLNNVYSDLGITYAWFSGPSTGGPYPTALGTSSTQPTGNLTTTTYYIAVITCTNGGGFHTTPEKSVIVNALPTVAVNPTSATYCIPGGAAVALTASGATTYTWSPTTGLTPTTGANVSASPSVNTTYTVTGTDANGCVNTATSAITVTNAITISSTTATPATICSGGTSTLNVNATIANSVYSVAAIGSPALLTPGASPTTTLSGAASFPVNTLGTAGDDSYSAAVAIPFSFGYNGGNITQFWVSTNGYITFNDPSTVSASAQRSPQTLPSTTAPNNVVSIFWHDMDIRTAGNVRYYTIGSTPNRQMVIEFNAIPTFNTTNLHSGQIVLYESQGTVDIVVSASASATKTLGIENSGGTAGVAGTGRNNATWTVSSIEGWRFTLPAPTFSWAPSGDVVSPTSQSTLTNPLTSTTTFTVTATNGGCSATGTATVTISAGASIVTDPSPTAKCAGETATFTVVASGPSLTYQWRKGGIDIPIGGNASAGTATLSLPNVTAGDADTYDVVVSSSCGSPVTSAGALLTVNPLPAIVVVSGAGTFCTSTTISASNGGDGTIYFQGTTSGGTSTATPSTLQTITTSGTYYFRAQSAAGCWGPEGSAVVVIQTAAGITGTDASICTGQSGTIAAVAANGCTAFANSGTTFGGTWVAGTDPIALRPTTPLANTATCGFDATITRNYVITTFQVSVSGNYSFEMNNNAGYDGMAYIVTGAFVPGNCGGGGTWIKGDDDGAVAADEPLLTATLSTGVTYKMISTTYSASTGTFSGSFAYTVIPPVGGQIMLPVAGNIEWYTAPSGGSAIGTGSPFNPVGVAGSGLADTNTPGTTTYYAACSNSSACRTAVNFVIKPNHDITATAGTGGSISPNGVTAVCEGTNQTYNITPDGCHTIADVIVDGVSQGAVGTYTFTNVTTTHTISASFTLNTYTITVTAGPNGSITPGTGSVNCGDNATYTITADACYAIADVLVDGVSVGAVGTYTFTNVQANHTISATFSQITYTITATSGANGSVTPAGASTVNCGANATYTITADACYAIADVLVDGVSVGAVGTYTFTNVQAGHTISATFSQITYTITATSGANGSVTPAGASTVNCGANATYTITPDACYAITDVLVDGVSVGAVGTYTFTNVQAGHTISATFSVITYTITATSGANGSVTPAGASTVNCGDNATYTITPDACYAVADVLVDGVSVGAVGTYTFTNVQAGHTISATFIETVYTITVTAGANGSITPGTGSVSCGANATYTITADACYAIADVLVDGVSVGAVGTYTFTNVQANHTISATFSQITYTITATSGANGSVTPAGASTVNCGANATYTITPDACYAIADVLVDGVSVGAVGTYTFTNVQAGHTISATFSVITYTITATSGANGSVTPAGASTVNCGANATYTITPDPCYAIADVLVDGVSVGAVGTYTFTNVQAGHTISATFVQTTYTITVTAGANGSITPGTGAVICGDNATYTITADACYSISDVLVDGVSVGAVGTYTFTNVQANHTISATFVQNTFTITVTSGANGLIAPGTGSVNCGANATYNILPNACYAIADVIVDGVSQGPVGTYTFTNVQANHTISASFVLKTYTITVTAGANGSITPGTGSVNCGANATYTITPDACYAIADVIVDGVSQGPVGTYTFTNVQVSHTISATFVATTYTITVTAGANGSITPGTGSVNCGDNATYTITPDACYAIADVIVDGVSQGPVGTYTFTNVQANHTISASFVQITYTITVTAGANGLITPGTGSVNCGANATYNIIPNACYAIADVIVDGVSQGPVGTYTFTNVTANHTISATFVLKTYTITVTPGANGSITPGTGSVNCGANATYTITADGGYAIDDVLVDGVSQGPVGTYTFTNVTVNHTISASFVVSGGGTFTITSSAGANGSISPNGATIVNSGASQSYTITPDACYHVLDVLVDAVSVGAVTSYTFTNVTANHTISATFAINAPLTVSVSGPVNVCPYVGTGTPVTYTATSAGATGFTWVIPPTNVTLISGQGTANLTVSFQNGFTGQANKLIKVTALSSCGNSAQLTYQLVAQIPGTPQPIVASSSNVCGVIGTAGTITYTIPATQGAASYNWTAQAGTTVINHPNGPGINDTTVTVSFTNGFTSSNITVSASSSCGTGGTRSLLITRANPSTPGLISGPTNACPYMAPGGTPATYSVVLVPNATAYTWTVPAGAIGLTGQGTNTISFTYPSGFVSGTVTVFSSNGCGNSGVRSLSISKLNPATPSIIDVIQTQPCPNREYTYTLSGMPANATSVQWTVPVGATLVSGQGSISITVSYPPTAFNSSVTAQAFNNCGSSTIRTAGVHIPVCPLERTPIAKGGSTVATPVESMQVNVYPNPTVNDFKLQVTTAGKEAINVRILDLQGRALRTFVVTAYQTTNVGSDLKAGTYMVEVRQGNTVKVTKLIKF